MCNRIQPWKPLMNFSKELFLILSLIMTGHSSPQGHWRTGRTNVWVSLPTKLLLRVCTNTEQSSAADTAELNKAEIGTET